MLAGFKGCTVVTRSQALKLRRQLVLERENAFPKLN